jgi:hypothetical protein
LGGQVKYKACLVHQLKVDIQNSHFAIHQQQQQQQLKISQIKTFKMLSNTKNLIAAVALLALAQNCPAPFLAAIPAATAAGIGAAVSFSNHTQQYQTD